MIYLGENYDFFTGSYSNNDFPSLAIEGQFLQKYFRIPDKKTS